MTTDRDQRVDERVAAQSAPVPAAHPVRERRRDERRTTDQHERVGDASARVVGHGAEFVGGTAVDVGRGRHRAVVAVTDFDGVVVVGTAPG